MLSLEGLARKTPEERAALTHILERDFSIFCRWVFPLLEGHPFHWGVVQDIIADFLSDVAAGKISRGIINTKPRFGKSIELAMWCAWWLVKQPTCQFLYLSSSDDLAKMQSDTVRKILKLPEVRLLWAIEFSESTDTKGLWKTKQGGGFRAVTTGGQVTGFGAGQYGAEDFRGAIIVDDPIKPEDARSIVKQEAMNSRYKTTIRNRLNDKRTPIIIVMQRLGDGDLSGFLLGGGSGEKWTVVRIPGLVDEEEEASAEARFSSDWGYGIPYPTGLDEGYVWPEKFGPAEDAAERLDPDTWSAQTMQNPRVRGGALFRVSWFRRFERFDVSSGVSGRVWDPDGNMVWLRYMAVTADTAMKTSNRNDFSVFMLWGIGMDGYLYLLDVLRGKWEAPELEVHSSAFLARYADRLPRRYGWRLVYIEDKSSGVGLIQQLRRTWGARVIPVPRGTDKVSRALGCLLPLQSGLVRIPREAPWTAEFLSEVAHFNKDMTHLHDDQVDAMMDAVHILGRSGGRTIYDVVEDHTVEV